ncbi:ATP phosphoribosyltransferase [Luteimonas pelagia]
MSPDGASPARERLRIAIQKSGRLAAPARALLAACGLAWREDRDGLFCHGAALPVDLLLVRDDDIPGLLAEGACEMGIVGRNVLREALPDGTAGVGEARALGFGGCRLMLAVPQAWDWDGVAALAGRRVATSYPRLLRAWLEAQGVQADIVTLSGSVEIAPRLGQADAVCDLVSSGATLAANGLKPVDTVLDSEAVLATRALAAGDPRTALAEMLARRIEGALRIRDSRLLLFQARRDAVPGLLRMLPDADAPTVMPVDGGDVLALQALCHGQVSWQRLEELRQAGARGLMVLPVERMLA